LAAERGEAMKLRVLPTIGLSLLIGACDPPPAPNYQAPNPTYYAPPTPSFSPGAASRLLKQDMTEEEVVRVLGEPTTTGLQTCGTALKSAPWQCKTMEYTAGSQ
jgi:hypothetical protein